MLSKGLSPKPFDSSFKYPPLGKEDWIRLVFLLPSCDDNIKCDLKVFTKATCPSYEALSYVWGTLNERNPIECCGTTFHVTENLKSALLNLRLKEKTRILWIDAICIYQADVAERTEQVKRMADIYKSAVETIVWLGPSSDASDEAISHLNTYGTFAQEHGLLSKMTQFSTLAADDVERRSALKTDITDMLGSLIAIIRQDLEKFCRMSIAWKQLTSRSYWGRVWILQEYALATALTIQCGASTIPFELFHGGLHAIQFIKSALLESFIQDIEESRARGDLFDPTLPMFSLIQQYAGREISGTAITVQGLRSHFRRSPIDSTLLRLLNNSFVERTAGATDPRDRIFAFLGIASDAEKLGIVADYSESNTYQDVFIATARAIATTSTVDILAFAQHRERSPFGLPSWVPDWTRPHESSEHENSDRGRPEGPILRPYSQYPWKSTYNASAGAEPYSRHPLLKALPATNFPLYGYTIDTIETVGPPCPDTTSSAAEDPSQQWPYAGGLIGNKRKLEAYLSEVKNICARSDEKFHRTGIEVYSHNDTTNPRTTAPYLIPVADIQQHGINSIRRADVTFSLHGYEQTLTDIHRSLHTAVGDLRHGSETESEEQRSYYQTLSWQAGRRPFLGENGTLGLVPDWAEEGDRVVIFCGAKFPYVLRRVGPWKVVAVWRVVGEAYVHGAMYGEWFEKERKMEDFVLT
jgi:heterokaryon incompatibility protein (HET)